MTTLTAESGASMLADRFGEAWMGRRVVVVGLGRSGASAARLLCRLGCKVYATESRSTPELARLREELYAAGAAQIELGGHTRELVGSGEVIIASPGVHEADGPLDWAKRAGTPVLSEIELAYRFCQAPVVAVTGTNGKSSVVTLISQVLSAAGRAAVACGNIGIPFSSVVGSLGPRSVAVVEVSSFQLLACERFRPSVGILLNIGSNHLDRHSDADSYLRAKARLFQAHEPQDWAVLYAGQPALRELGAKLRSRVVWFGTPDLNPPAFALAPATLRAFGLGAQAVLQAARILGVADPLTCQAIRSFRGLEHRMEDSGTVRGVRFINDSKSTTPDSLLFAVSQTRGPLVLIAGGRDKGMDFAPLAETLKESRIKGVVLIGETRQRLRGLLEGIAGKDRVIREAESLPEAVRDAASIVGSGGTVLFSPGCASFDMFRDFEERGRAYKASVSALAGQSTGSVRGTA